MAKGKPSKTPNHLIQDVTLTVRQHRLVFTEETARSGFWRQNQGNWLNWGDGAVSWRQTGGTLALAGRAHRWWGALQGVMGWRTWSQLVSTHLNPIIHSEVKSLSISKADKIKYNKVQMKRETIENQNFVEDEKGWSPPGGDRWIPPFDSSSPLLSKPSHRIMI